MMNLLSWISSFLFLTFLSNANINSSYVTTSIGYRPKECVHYAKEDAVLTVTDSGIKAYYPKSQLTEFHPKLDICVNNAKELSLLRSQKLNNNNNRKKSNGVTEWEVYSSANMPSTMGTFKATYIIPNESPSPNGGELLYFFLGLQNDDQTDLTIIQPVVSYCADCDDSQLPKGWSMMATNCCPAGQTWYGPVISIEAGATIQALATANSSYVYVTETYDNKQSSLTVKDIQRNFNWAAVTLEQYFVNACSEYNTSPFNVSNMVLTTEDGKSVDPKWTANNDNNCGGKAEIFNYYEVLIYGSKN